MIKVGIIGGTGLENPDILKEVKKKYINTPWGYPSSDVTIGKINDVEVLILSRHGRDHSITPTFVNNRANIYALKEEGCTHIIATTACGSLREEIKRGDTVIMDQFIDFTRRRDLSFYESFDNGEIKHVSMAEPFDSKIRRVLIDNCKKLGISYHDKGTVITIEGPRFSTKAESKMFRLWGADIINMSIAPECILANELGIAYAAIGIVTDYDCWKEDEIAVSWEEVFKIFKENVDKVIRLIINTISDMSSRNDI